MGYRLQYAEIQSGSQTDSRGLERGLLLRSVAMMRDAMDDPGNYAKVIEARHFVGRIWTALLQDLSSTENQLSNETRAGLISVGIWALRELESLRDAESAAFDDLIEITSMIAEGLQ
jgi:flagellar biosynthesis activator protein FlaF